MYVSNKTAVSLSPYDCRLFCSTHRMRCQAMKKKKTHKKLLLLKICYLNLLSEIGQKGQSTLNESEILSTQSDI